MHGLNFCYQIIVRSQANSFQTIRNSFNLLQNFRINLLPCQLFIFIQTFYNHFCTCFSHSNLFLEVASPFFVHIQHHCHRSEAQTMIRSHKSPHFYQFSSLPNNQNVCRVTSKNLLHQFNACTLNLASLHAPHVTNEGGSFLQFHKTYDIHLMLQLC